MKNLSQFRIVFLILAIVSIGFILHTIETYREQRADISAWSRTTQNNVDRLYKHVFETAEAMLSSRASSMLVINNHRKKLDAIRLGETEKIRRLFSPHFRQLKEQIAGFDIMQIISTEGRSLYRFHRPGEYGDDLTAFRPSVAAVLASHQPVSFFESGVHGLYFRYIHPIFDEGVLVGFIEMGIQPEKLLKETAEILSLRSYIFKKFSTPGTQKLPNDYALCDLSRDSYSEAIMSKINFSRPMQIIQHDGKHLLVITKALFDGRHEIIGKSIFVENIELLYDELNKSMFSNIVTFAISVFIIYFLLNAFINKLLTRTREIKLLLDNANDAIYLIRLENGRVVDTNQRAAAMLQYSVDTLRTMHLEQFRKPLPGVAFSWEEHVNKLRLNHFIVSRGLHVRKDGTTFPVEASLSYIIINNVEHMIAVARDITKQLALEHDLEERKNSLEQMQSVLSESALYTTSDLKGDITYISNALLKLTGYRREEIIGKNHRVFKHQDNPPNIYRDIWQTIGKENKTWRGEIKNRAKNGDAFWIYLVINPMFDKDGKKIGYYSYRENISDKKAIIKLSEHDPLTGAYNRRKGDVLLQELHREVIRYGKNVTLTLMDIDHFKQINDTYGHAEGDTVLQTLTRTIHHRLRATDTLVRWGGEEFLIITPHSTVEETRTLIESLRDTIALTDFAPMGVITCSFGIAELRADRSVEASVNEADRKLYRSKADGRNRVT